MPTPEGFSRAIQSSAGFAFVIAQDKEEGQRGRDHLVVTASKEVPIDDFASRQRLEFVRHEGVAEVDQEVGG